MKKIKHKNMQQALVGEASPKHWKRYGKGTGKYWAYILVGKEMLDFESLQETNASLNDVSLKP